MILVQPGLLELQEQPGLTGATGAKGDKGDTGDSVWSTYGNEVSVDGDVKSTFNGTDFFMVPRGGIIMWSGSLASIPTGWVLCDGTHLDDTTYTIASGAIAPTISCSNSHVGLQVISKLQPMKIDGISMTKRIGTIIPDFYNTLGGKHGDSESNLYSNSLKDGDSLDPDEALFSGHVDLPFDGAYTRELDLWFTQTAPLPLHLRGVAVQLSQESI